MPSWTRRSEPKVAAMFIPMYSHQTRSKRAAYDKRGDHVEIQLPPVLAGPQIKQWPTHHNSCVVHQANQIPAETMEILRHSPHATEVVSERAKAMRFAIVGGEMDQRHVAAQLCVLPAQRRGFLIGAQRECCCAWPNQSAVTVKGAH